MGWVSAVDSQRRTIWIVDAQGYGKRFIVRAEEILTAFVETAARPLRTNYCPVAPPLMPATRTLLRRFYMTSVGPFFGASVMTALTSVRLKSKRDRSHQELRQHRVRVRLRILGPDFRSTSVLVGRSESRCHSHRKANHNITLTAGMPSVVDCVRDGIGIAILEPTEWQRIGD